jgi:hypothetical protein
MISLGYGFPSFLELCRDKGSLGRGEPKYMALSAHKNKCRVTSNPKGLL